MSILMEALKQQVEPAPATARPHSGNGWRNLALLLGFVLALLLGFALASWWQSTNVSPANAHSATTGQPKAEHASSASIVAALESIATEVSADLPAKPTATTPSQPAHEQLKPEPKVVRVTAQEPPQALAAVPAATAIDNAVAPEPEVEVSDELRQRFASAMAASEIDPRQLQPKLRGSGSPAKDINELAPALQRQIPPLRFEAHVYATQSQQRWIKVNGKSLQEGQWVTADIRLKEITPQFVLLEMGAELFSMPALTDWPQQ